jgi:deoxyribonuclease-4
LFRQTHEALGPFALAAHAGYLVNLASPDRALRERSIRTMIRELERCEALGIPLLVFHPGAHMGAGDARGLRRIAGALRRIHAATSGMRVKTTIENTAGQGSALGSRLSQIARLLDASGESARLRVCFDTAHAFAAGYDFRSREQYRALWDEFEGLIGLKKLAIFHLNDSVREAGSLVDRHAHIGQGRIGRKPFGWLMTDARFRRVPKIIETPKRGGMDRSNLALLRRLAARGGPIE